MKALLDGSGVTAVVESNIRRIKDLALDQEEKRLFWLDLDKKTIESADLNGQNRMVCV